MVNLTSKKICPEILWKWCGKKIYLILVDGYNVKPTGEDMEWIKCSEKLPELYAYVLVLADNKGTGEPKPISIAMLDNENNWDFVNHTKTMSNYGVWMDIEYVMDEEDITHWMLLPKLPKEE